MAKKSRSKSASNGARLIPSAVDTDIGLLDFDSRNPRLVETTVDSNPDEQEIIRTLWQEMEVEELAISIAANGFFRHEVLFAIPETNGHFTVIEGNRRLAACKLLLDDKLRRAVGATNLPKIDASAGKSISKLPVIATSRKEMWQYIGFKHVNGARPWGAFSKAEYIARVHKELGEPLPEVARRIGDRHSTVNRLYRGLMVLDQAKNAGVYDLNDRWRKGLYFSHLYTGLGYTGIQEFLGLKEDRSYKPNPLPKKNLRKLGQLCVWMFGSKSSQKPPIIRSQNPDLRILDATLQTEDGTDALMSGMPLQVAHEASLGDERIFKQSLIEAKISLQKAFGTVHTGCQGDKDSQETANAIFKLSSELLDTIDGIASEAASKRKSPVRRKKRRAK